MPFSRPPHDFTPAEIEKLRQEPGVYGITNASLEMLYIGQTDTLRRRLGEHYKDNKLLLWQYAPKKFYYQIVEGSETVRRKHEAKLLEEYGAPPCNK